MLWPDTFNNYFHPETAIAALELIQSAGFDVAVPGRAVCCGRPLYDYGLLDLAKRQLRDVLDGIRDDVRTGIPVIVLEPSCAAVFRDEMVNLLPDDEDAKRLAKQVRLLPEFVQEHRDRFTIPKIGGRALYHPHCHQKAIFGTAADRSLLADVVDTVEAPDTGCCGMAGSFGFEADHYDISMKVGERVVLPAVREADPDTVIVADGFSCREQIAQGTHRRAIHLAELLRLAQRRGVIERDVVHPEQLVIVDHAAESATRAAAFGAATLIVSGVACVVRGWYGRYGKSMAGESRQLAQSFPRERPLERGAPASD